MLGRKDFDFAWSSRPGPVISYPVAYCITKEDKPTLEQRDSIFWLLEGFNNSQAGSEPELPLAILVQDDQSNVITGGLWGLTYYSWMFVELLFVPEEMRGQGIGRQLMLNAESEAVRRGCHGAWLETFTFQARGFYEKLGYRAFGTIPSYPPGHKRIFMLKWLTPERI